MPNARDVPRTGPGSPAGGQHLFVYGTLKRGGEAEAQLEGGVYVRDAAVHGALFRLPHYPALVLGGADPVFGEIWRCPDETLARLDTYEGVDTGLFQRVRTVAAGVECWTYVAGPALSPMLRSAPPIANGFWPVRDPA